MKFLLAVLITLCSFSCVSYPVFAGGFLSDFAGPLLKKGGNGDEKAYSFEGLAQNNKIIDNIKSLFYPDGEGGSIRNFIRTIAVAIFFVLLVRTGFQFVLHADNPETVNKTKMNLLYIILGAFVFFLARWILNKLLDIGDMKGLFGDPDAIASKANETFLIVLAFLKTLGFFLAIFFIVRYGFQMVTAVGEDAKIKSARQGLLNVVLALIFIKIVDYVYYISFSGNFTNNAINFIVQASKFIAYIIGGALVLALIYAGYLMVTSTGQDENIKKGKNIVKSVFIVGLLVLLFLLVIHQIFKDIYS